MDLRAWIRKERKKVAGFPSPQIRLLDFESGPMPRPRPRLSLVSTYFIGDVHGCCRELEALLEKIDPGPGDRVYLTGDAFDRGPDPEGVFDLIQSRGLISIQSNHEAFLLKVLQEGSPSRHGYIQDCLEALSGRREEFQAYLEALPLARKGEGWLLVHAGIDPYQGFSKSTPETILMVRNWPRNDPLGVPWYQHYQGPELVIFGHNAKKEPVLFRREGKLLAVGLDTGCVYGGSLTAFCLEDERLIQVPSPKDYRKRSP